MRQAVSHGGDHRIGVMRLVTRRVNRLVKTGNDQIQRAEHGAGAVDFALLVFNIGFDAAQYADAVDDARPDFHIHEVPVVRGISHIGAMVSNGEQPDAVVFCLRDIVMQRTVGVGAGNGMHM